MDPETQAQESATSTHRPSWRDDLAADYEVSRARLAVELANDVEEHL